MASECLEQFPVSNLCKTQVAINGNFLSKFLNCKEEDRIHQLLVDDERNILYSLDEGGRIQVNYYLH